MQNHSTTTPAILPERRPATADIELTGIQHDNGKLFVSFSGGGIPLWMLECKASDLQSFSKFQQAVAHKFGTWIDHHSQSHRRAAHRKGAWDDAVRDAFHQRDKVLAEYDRGASQ